MHFKTSRAIAGLAVLAVTASGCAFTAGIPADSAAPVGAPAIESAAFATDSSPEAATVDASTLEEPTLTSIGLTVPDGTPATTGDALTEEPQESVPVTDDSVALDISDDDGVAASPAIESEEPFQTVAVSWPLGTEVPALSVRVRDADGEWGEWFDLEDDGVVPDAGTEEAKAGVRAGTDSLYVGQGEAIQIATAPDADPVTEADGVELVLIGSPEPESSDATATQNAASSSQEENAAPQATISNAVYHPGDAEVQEAASVASRIIPRSTWGATAPICAMGSASTIKLAVVHHTAGGNGYTTQAAAMQQLRNDQRYHTQGRGWCDLGYNFVVDKWGNIYEGRQGSLDRARVGVHASGFNTETLGVSVLGNYDLVDMPSAAVNAVADVIGMRFATYKTNPRGNVNWVANSTTAKQVKGRTYTMPTVVGHRDVAFTACPGRYGYAKLAAIRSRAGNYVANNATGVVVRLGSGSRYTVSAQISAATYKAGVSRVYVSSGAKYHESLLATRLAARFNLPHLMITKNGIPAKVAAELKRLKPKEIVIVGSGGSVSASAAKKLRALPFEPKVSRISGSNRATLSANVAKKSHPNTASTVVIASQSSVIQTLTATSIAAKSGAALLLVPQGTGVIPLSVRTELTRLKPARITILGTPNGVSDSMAASLRRIAPVQRWGSGSRYTMAAEAHRNAFARSSTVYITSGVDRWTTLTGGALAGGKDLPVLLAGKNSLPAATRATLKAWQPNRIVIIGGTGTVSAAVERDLRTYLPGGSSVWTPPPAPAEPTAPPAVPAPAPTATPAPVKTITFTGRGWGHGRGMGQYGAYGYAKDKGWTSEQILEHFYQPATLKKDGGNPTVDVELSAHTNKTVTLVGAGLTVGGVAVPGSGSSSGQVALRISRSGKQLSYQTGTTCNGTFSATKTNIASGTVVKASTSGNTNPHKDMIRVCQTGEDTVYRGSMVLRVYTNAAGAHIQYLINQVTMQQYLQGVVPRESPASWGNAANKGMAALEAQAVAARSYAMGEDRLHGVYDTCDSTSCQVYGGAGRYVDNDKTYPGTFYADREHPNTNAAVTATNGWVMRFAGSPGKVARTEFSSSTGGYTAGGTFTAVPDEGDAVTANPNRTWTVAMTPEAVAKAFGFSTITSITVTKRNGLGADGGR
ncbi:MAG: N-acetylmuramoyl-L-alanine amidase, partial [Cellulomonadaceae bacterium]|nr:N-acetylmuramoyl-L-alanine amidase [Cellulomonadaceae bacterium]